MPEPLNEIWAFLKEFLTPTQYLGVCLSIAVIWGAKKFSHSFYPRFFRLIWASGSVLIGILWVVIVLTTKVAPTPPEKIGIWVAQIKGDEKGMEQQGIVERLQDALREAGLQNEVEVRKLNYTISGEVKQGMANASKWGQKVDAKIVVWGNQVTEMGKSLFYPKIKILQSTRIKNQEPPQKVVTNRENVSLPPEYIDEIAFLSYFLTGYIYYEKNKYQLAISRFEEFIKITSERPSPSPAVETKDASFLLATAYLDLIHNLAGEERRKTLLTSIMEWPRFG